MTDSPDIIPQTARGLLSERQAAEYLNVSLRTIISWRDRGLIPYFRIGRSIRYSREQIDGALMERHQCNAEALP